MIDYKDLAGRIKTLADRYEDSSLADGLREEIADLRTVVSLLEGMAEEKPVAWIKTTHAGVRRLEWHKQTHYANADYPATTEPLYLHPAPQPQPERHCIGNDSSCPCQDGDPCHYRDHGDTKAMPQPQPEPTEAQIEAAAQRMCQLKADRLSLDFDYLWQQAKDGLIEEARAVLRDALAAKESK